MNSTLSVALDTTPEQTARLKALQAAFAEVCNALSPLVQERHCWNRVTLHHLAYKSLREQFPAIGSQMICNAIYSVSRTGRVVFQHPQSPFHHTRLKGKLPLIRFSDNSPVYFDRHTLSLKAGVLSLYTLDGRMRFKLAMSGGDEATFHGKKLREVVLSRRPDGKFELMFWFNEMQADDAAAPVLRQQGEIPGYIKVEATA